MWVPGGKPTGYLKKKLFEFVSKWLSVDAYLIYYPTYSGIPEHVDEVDGKQHWRINFIYKNCELGGIFRASHYLLNLGWLNIFRSDRPHSVSRIEAGERKVLSFGIAF